MRQFFDLTKSGIVVFVLVTGAAGFALSWPPYEVFDFGHLIATLASLYFFSSGSFALNQAQEWRLDREMPRTQKRPIPAGKISVFQATFLGIAFVSVGFLSGLLVNFNVAMLGLATVLLYNLCYTIYWKRKWTFGAVPGAIPGAMPVVIGYAANSDHLFHPEVIHAFLLMFLWQMPHFWSLAIKFKDDYSKGGVPVLPVMLGTEKTLFHIGLYMFAYVAVAVAAPWFTNAYFVYAFVVVPISFKILFEFFRYYRSGGQTHWLPFFLWTNFSMLIFLIAPVIDKWQQFYFGNA